MSSPIYLHCNAQNLSVEVGGHWARIERLCCDSTVRTNPTIAKEAYDAAVKLQATAAELCGVLSRLRAAVILATPDSDLAVDGAIEAIRAGNGGPVNEAQRTELGQRMIASALGRPPVSPESRPYAADRDAADAAVISAEQDANHRRTVGATRARMNGGGMC